MLLNSAGIFYNCCLMNEENPELLPRREAFTPTIATVDAWEAQAHMLAYHNSPRGSEQAEQALVMALDAFECVVEHTRPRLFAATLNKTNGRIHDAEDIIQEVFIRAYKYLPRFRGDSQIETWLHEIMINQVGTYYKKESKHTSNRSNLEGDGSLGIGEKFMAPESESPEWVAYQNELRESLHEALSQLTPTLRSAATLYYLRDLSHAQIAKILGVAENTAKLRVHRAREKLSQLPIIERFRDK